MKERRQEQKKKREKEEKIFKLKQVKKRYPSYFPSLLKNPYISSKVEKKMRDRIVQSMPSFSQIEIYENTLDT